MQRIAQVVITIHGVESRGEWQDKIHPEFTGIDDLKHYPHNYGRVRGFRFWKAGIPLLRNREIRKFYTKYSEIRERHPGMAPSIISHSFGTYIVSRVLQKYPSVEFDRVILCGSIISRAYDWRRFVRECRVRRIRNEVAKDDPVVRLFRRPLMRWLIPMTGPSGIDRFTGRCEQLEQPVFEFTHSDHFVANDHCRTFWMPFIRGTQDLRALCRRCQTGGVDARQANEDFDVEYSHRIEACVRRLFHSANSTDEQIRDYCRLVRKGVIDEGALGRQMIDQIIERETLALWQVLRERN